MDLIIFTRWIWTIAAAVFAGMAAGESLVGCAVLCGVTALWPNP